MTHPDLVRHPRVDISNAPSEQEEDRLYLLYLFMRDFDEMLPTGRYVQYVQELRPQ